ncbi:MAG: hypothetical protein D3923_09780, partial [Candidatus Electrothrix sp. AR3]|nr:hypothetical protein [Candidatus Electrothrix sp. AR3]
PLHADYVSFSFGAIFPRLGYYLSFLGKGQGRYVWTVLALAASLLFLVQQREMLFSRSTRSRFLTEKKWHIVLILILYIILSLLVSILNFHLARYILLLMPALCMLIAAQVVYIIKHFKHPAWKYPLVALLFIPLLYSKGTIFNVDADMGYVDIVKAQHEIVFHLNEVSEEDDVIVADFPLYHGLIEPRAGYSRIKYKRVFGCGSEEAAQADYLLFSAPGNLDSCRPDNKKHTLLKKIKSPLVKMYLYKNTVKGKGV